MSKPGVVTGTLPTTGTLDLTISGFGTVSAAIVFVGNANTTNNPEDDLSLSIGFWDGVNSVQHCNSVYSEHNVSTTVCDRWKDTDKIFRVSGYTGTCAAITDGIRITVSGSTGVARYVWALFIGGAGDVHLAEQSLGTGTSAIDITAPGFKPSIVFLSTIGDGTSGNSTSTHSIISFGAARNNSSDIVNQASVLFYSEDSQASVSDTGSYSTETYAVGQFFNGSLSWGASLSAFDTSGFSITPSTNTGGDYVSYLAIQLTDTDSAWIDAIDMATGTGSSATTGLGFQPAAVALFASYTTALNTPLTHFVHSVGGSDGTRERSISGWDRGSQATSNAGSRSNTTSILNFSNTLGTSDGVATLSSLDSDGFTLNYSDGAGSAFKILAFAIGDSTAGGGGPSVNINGSTVSWNGLTSYNWNGIA